MSDRPPSSSSVEIPVSDPDPPSTARKPLLASEALKADLAPSEPWRRTCQLWCLAGALVFFLCGFFFVPKGAAPESAWLCFGLGGWALVAAALPVPYIARAIMIFLCGATGGLAALWATGPGWLVGARVGKFSIAYLLVATALPTALLFRARFRAYARARRMLGLALLFAGPFVVQCIVTFLEAPYQLQLVNAVALVVIALSLLGFMGAETTVAGQYVAGAVIVVSIVQLATLVATRNRIPLTVNALGGPLLSLIGFGLLALLTSLGAFQMLAHWNWRRAQQVNVHRPTTIASRDPLPSRADSFGDD